MSVAGKMLVLVDACLFWIVIWWWFLKLFRFFWFLGVHGGGGGVVVVEVAWGEGVSVGDGDVDFSEDADLSGGGDNDLGGGGARFWVRYRLPRVGREFWEKFPNSPQFFF